MKLLFDFLPLVLFFVAFKLYGIYIATATAIAVGLAQILYLMIARKKIEFMHWLNVGIIAVFGGATLLFHSETFIKWKPTVLYWAFAVAMVVSQVVFRRNPIQALLSKQVELPEPVWLRLNVAWSLFFTVMGALNLYVAYYFPTPTWVNFKVFGILGLMMVFIVIQTFYISRYVKN